MTITIEVFLMTKEKTQDAIYTRRYIYNFHYHLIWATKYRHQTFSTKELADEMKDILRMVAKGNEIVIEKMEVMPDHVHVLISFPPSKAPTSAIKALKGRSSQTTSRNSTITILGWSFMFSQLLYEYAWQYE